MKYEISQKEDKIKILDEKGNYIILNFPDKDELKIVKEFLNEN
jgi:hypothetical protein